MLILWYMISDNVLNPSPYCQSTDKYSGSMINTIGGRCRTLVTGVVSCSTILPRTAETCHHHDRESTTASADENLALDKFLLMQMRCLFHGVQTAENSRSMCLASLDIDRICQSFPRVIRAWCPRR
jgi:hypothetical protein